MSFLLSAFADELEKLSSSKSLAGELGRSAATMGGVSLLLGHSPETAVKAGIGGGVGDVAGGVLARKLGLKGWKEYVARVGLGAAGMRQATRKIGEGHRKHAAADRSYPTPGSSNVAGFRYDPKTQQLYVSYRGGGTYRYNGVPSKVFKSLKRNKSAGKTIHKSIKLPGYSYEKVGAKLAKSYTCKFCKDPATKGVIWAEGRAIVPCCDKHLAKGKAAIGEEPDAIRDLTKSASNESSSGSPGSGYGELLETTGGQPFVDQRATKGESFLRERVREGGKVKKASLTSRSHGFAGAGGTGGEIAHGGGAGSVVPHDAAASFVDRKVTGKKISDNLLKRAAGGTKRGFNGWSPASAKDQIRKKRRQVEKIAGVCKKTLTWGGLTMKFEYLNGDTRSGVNGTTGKKWSRVMRDCYGYMPGTYGKGADGEAIDVYFNPEPLDGPVYKIRQLKKDGTYDEDKFMVGYGDSAAARRAFSRNMPKWAFGDMTEMGMKSFRHLVGQDNKQVRVPSDGNAERERVQKALKGKTA